MTAKEKAESLVLKFKIFLNYDQVSNLKFHDPSPKNSDYHQRVKRDAKILAIIAVDEIIDSLDQSLINVDIEWFKQVKQEINKL